MIGFAVAPTGGSSSFASSFLGAPAAPARIHPTRGNGKDRKSCAATGWFLVAPDRGPQSGQSSTWRGRATEANVTTPPIGEVGAIFSVRLGSCVGRRRAAVDRATLEACRGNRQKAADVVGFSLKHSRTASASFEKREEGRKRPSDERRSARTCTESQLPSWLLRIGRLLRIALRLLTGVPLRLLTRLLWLVRSRVLIRLLGIHAVTSLQF